MKSFRRPPERRWVSFSVPEMVPDVTGVSRKETKETFVCVQRRREKLTSLVGSCLPVLVGRPVRDK